jgi:hypothetical protein
LFLARLKDLSHEVLVAEKANTIRATFDSFGYLSDSIFQKESVSKLGAFSDLGDLM